MEVVNDSRSSEIVAAIPEDTPTAPNPPAQSKNGVIVHEWLEMHGGAEKVMSEIMDLFPTADALALWNDAPGRFSEDRVKETWIARTPFRKSKSLALPLMPTAWRHLGDRDPEWVLCVSHLFAHHARFSGAGKGAPKYAYVYTPARYIWNPEFDRRGKSLAVRGASALLRPLDRQRAQEATSIVGISEFVSKRIEDAWHRESEVIYPPVEVDSFARSHLNSLSPDELEILDRLPSAFVMGASRFIPYKRLDLAIALGVSADVHVVIAGDGPLRSELKALADKHPGQVTFVRSPSLGLLREIYVRALAYVFPPVEDFGIMPVEAMATGTPVITSSIGGASETVVHGRTGIHLDSWDPRAMREALEACVTFDPATVASRAWAFDRAVFHRKMLEWVGKR